MRYIDRAAKTAGLALAFGRVDRVTLHEDGERFETDTDHTVMLALVACDFAEYLPCDLDLGLVAQMALVHDLVEAYAGDTPTLVISDAARESKERREHDAVIQLLQDFGPGSWLGRTIVLYERLNTPEARYVKVLDKVMPKLTHLLNGCAAASRITDAAGFELSHRTQLAKPKAEYPDVHAEVFGLLDDAMQASEKAWVR